MRKNMAFIRILESLMRSKNLIGRRAYSGRAALFSTAASEVCIENVADVKPFEEIPGPKGAFLWPVIGPLLHFKPFTDIAPERFDKLLDQMFDKYGPIFKFNLESPLVMVYHPKDIETIFKNEGKYPLRPGMPLEPVYTERNKSTPNISETDGKEWHVLRAPLNRRLLKVDSASYYLEPQNGVTDDFVKILARNDKRPEDLAELFFCYAAESIGVVCFNARLGFLDSAAMQNPETRTFLKASRDLFACLQKSLLQASFKLYRSKLYRNYEQIRYQLAALTLQRIEEAKQVLESRKKNGTLDPEEPNLLLSLLSDSSIPYSNVLSIMESLYVAGTDSTANNLQTFFYNMATNPDKQEKLREEIRNVLGQDNPLTAKDLAKMPYLKSCLKESFRFVYPLVSGSRRILPVDVVLSGYRIPAGTLIGMHNPRTCREYFSNSDKFIPERWLRSSDGNLKEEIPATASLPFGAGPRNCIGRRFAEQEMYLAVTKVMQKLKIETDPSSKTSFIYALFVQPEKPINFKFTKLDD